MPGSAYIDTSVLGAYYCPEAGSEVAEAALRRIQVPVISLLVEVEFHSLVAKKRRLKELTDRQAKRITDLFASHIAEGYYRRVLLMTDDYLKARDLLNILATPLHTLDALHLAVALREDIPLMTSDQGLSTAAKRHKCGVVWVKVPE